MSKIDNGGDDGKYFVEGRAQFTIENMQASDFVTEACWDDDDLTPFTDEELDILGSHFADYIHMEWVARFSRSGR